MPLKTPSSSTFLFFSLWILSISFSHVKRKDWVGLIVFFFLIFLQLLFLKNKKVSPSLLFAQVSISKDTYCFVFYVAQLVLFFSLIEADADSSPACTPCTSWTMDVWLHILRINTKKNFRQSKDLRLHHFTTFLPWRHGICQVCLFVSSVASAVSKISCSDFMWC